MSIIKGTNAFNSGQISPRLQQRIDVDKWDRGAKNLTNFLVTPYGGAFARPGTEYCDETAAMASSGALIPFNFNTDTGYVVELGPGTMRFFKDCAVVSSGSSTASAWSTSPVPFVDYWDNGARHAQTPQSTIPSASTGTYAAWMDTTSYNKDDHGVYVDSSSTTREWSYVHHTPGGAERRWYKALSNHVSAAANDEPGVGSNWNEKWELVEWNYKIGDLVLGTDNLVYRCILDHMVAPDTRRPITGTGYATYWTQTGEVRLSTPWLEEELKDVQYVQINDLMYFVHPNHAPRKLTRVADDDWTIEKLEDGHDVDNWPPFLANNKNTWQVATVNSDTGPAIVTIGGSAFDAQDVGRFIRLSYDREPDEVTLVMGSGATYAPIYSDPIWVEGAYSIIIPGGSGTETSYGWSGYFDVEASDDLLNWDSLSSWFNGNPRSERLQVNASGSTLRGQWLRMRFTRTDYPRSGEQSLEAVLTRERQIQQGFLKITGFISSSQVFAEWIAAVGNADELTTDLWSLGSWHTIPGYPRAISLHDQRLVIGGSLAEQQTLYLSAVNSFEDFREGEEDDDAVKFLLASTEYNRIEWLASANGLLIGTSGSEWGANSYAEDGIITPTSARVQRFSSFGSDHVMPVAANNVVLFVSRLGRKVHELTFDAVQGNFLAPDLALMAEDLTEGRLERLAYQQQREGIVWSKTASNKLLAMAYQREHNVVAWSPQELGGTGVEVEDVCVLYGDTEDEVYFLVKRTIDGGVKRYVERFRPGWGTSSIPGWPLAQCHYVDSGKTVLGSGMTAITGAGHLEGETVQILADGRYLGTAVVTAGGFTLPLGFAANEVHYGLGYNCDFEPLPFEILGLPDGTSQSRAKRVHRLSLRVLGSGAFKYGQDADNLYQHEFRKLEDPMDVATPLFTGWVDLQIDGSHTKEGDILIRQDLPLPLTILSCVAKFSITGDEGN